jgi:cyclophilin family peptidyl-prolyl cis-trans isomerase
VFNISQAGLRRSSAVLGLTILIVSGSWGAAGGGAVAQESECWTSAPSMDLGYPQWSEAPQMVIDTSKTYVATLETNRGNIVIELADDEAPNTVNNYVCLARAGYYDVTIFHRVIVNFVIQGGDPTGTGTGGPGYEFDDELPEGEAPYVRGTLAMANAGANTNGSQFFIVHQDQSADFDPNYSIFGHVTEGLDVLDTIATIPVGPSPRGDKSSPLVTIGIKTITITES